MGIKEEELRKLVIKRFILWLSHRFRNDHKEWAGACGHAQRINAPYLDDDTLEVLCGESVARCKRKYFPMSLTCFCVKVINQYYQAHEKELFEEYHKTMSSGTAEEISSRLALLETAAEGKE